MQVQMCSLVISPYIEHISSTTSVLRGETLSWEQVWKHVWHHRADSQHVIFIPSQTVMVKNITKYTMYFEEPGMLTNVGLVAIHLASQHSINVHAVPERPIWL